MCRVASTCSCTHPNITNENWSVHTNSSSCQRDCLSTKQLQSPYTKWTPLRCLTKLLHMCVIITQWRKKNYLKKLLHSYFHPFQDKKRRAFRASLFPKKKQYTPPESQNLAEPPCVTIFHTGMASSLTNRMEMEHLALPLTVKKIYSSLCACICGSWQGLPQPLLQGHGLNFDPWGWLYHSFLPPFLLSNSLLSYSFVSLPHLHTHKSFPHYTILLLLPKWTSSPWCYL